MLTTVWSGITTPDSGLTHLFNGRGQLVV